MELINMQELAERLLNGTISEEERELFEAWYDQQAPDSIEWLTADTETALKERMYKGIMEKVGQEEMVQQDEGEQVIELYPEKRNHKWRWVAAAVALFILGGGVWFIFSGREKQVDMASLSQAERFKNDINPASEGIVLETGDGKKIQLDSTGNGRLTTNGNVQLSKSGNSIAYLNDANEVFYHTISTNKGKDYHLTLADGTEVWLDAQSSIHFPTAFTGKTREVEITGQAYFEVAKNPAKPFQVKTNGQLIEVLGTHFNVNAHEAVVKTTLLEGRVKVQAAGTKQSLFIAPGQQAVLSNNQLSATTAIDMEEVMAWKNGKFYFDGAGVEAIMAQVSRWYDIEVAYKNKINETFVADLPRNLPVSRILSLLEKTKQIEFLIEGNKVTVMHP